MAELNRQRPDTAMHMAPCTKASSSSSRGASARMRAMSATLISRAHTTRLAPSSCHMRAASAFMTPACVLTCSSTCGACRRASEKAPRSLAIERIGARRVERLQVRGQRREVVGAHKRIHGHVGLRAGRMSAGHRRRHVVEREVRGALAQPEAVAGEVHRVRPEAHRRLQLRPPAGRREELGDMCRLISHAPYCSAGRRRRNPSLKSRARKEGIASASFPSANRKTFKKKEFSGWHLENYDKKGATHRAVPSRCAQCA